MKLINPNFLLIALLFLFSPSISFAQGNSYGITDLGYPFSDDSQFRNKTDVACDKQGNVWISFRRSNQSTYSLAKYNSGSWEVFSRANSILPSDTISKLLIHNDKLYIVTAKGIVIYNNGDWSLFEGNETAPSLTIQCLDVNTDYLYAGTGSGLMKYSFKNHSWTVFNTDNSGLLRNMVLAIQLTDEGNLWIGTQGDLSYFNHQDWTSYTTANSGLLTDGITGLQLDDQDNLWIIINYDGVYCLQNNQIKRIFYTNYEYQTYNFANTSDNTFLLALGNSFYKSSHNQLFRYLKYHSSSRLRYCIKGDKIYYTSEWKGQLFMVDLSKTFSYPNDDTLNVNGINILINSTGMLYNRFHNASVSLSGSNKKKLLHNNMLWFSAKGPDGQRHLSAETYPFDTPYEDMDDISFDFCYGPYSKSGDTSIVNAEKWNNVWKVTKQQIDFHKTHYNHPDYIMPWAIKNWPTHGDKELGHTSHLAPYTDINNNGHYEPHLGDFPIIRGDHAAYFISNDFRYPNYCSRGKPLEIEISGMAYTFNNASDSTLLNSFFVSYQVVNKSANQYDSLVISCFSDFNIGVEANDLFGCDTLLDAVFAYNDSNLDFNYDNGSGFGYNPPAFGMVLLNHELTGAIGAYHNDLHNRDLSFPGLEDEFFNWISNKWNDGSPIVIGGIGYPGSSGAGNEISDYLFPGDVNNPNQWNAIGALSQINEIRNRDFKSLANAYIGSFGPNERICFDLAFVYARDFEGDHIASVNLLKNRILDVQDFYDNNFLNDCFDIIPNNIVNHKPEKNTIKIYPNPVNEKLFVEILTSNLMTQYQVFDLMGRIQFSGFLNPGRNEIPTLNLGSGIYFIRINDPKTPKSFKFIKF